MDIINLKGDPKTAWASYKTHNPYKESTHLKKNALREQVRPTVGIPPSKAFPKEMEVINKLLIAEKQRTQHKSKKQNSSNNKKEKLLSKSSFVEVFC